MMDISNTSESNNTEYLSNFFNTSVIDSDNNVTLNLIIVVYVVLISFGTFLNFSLLFTLVRHKRCGIMSLILQLSATDILASWVALSEVWTLRNSSWVFEANLCPLFLGSEVFVNTVTIYFIICINLQALSFWNEQKHVLKSNNRNPLINDTEDSSECLVTRSENTVPNRNVNIDYRRSRGTLSTVVPSLLILFTCISLSIPEFTLSSTFTEENNSTLCTVVDLHYGQLFQILLLTFRVIVPFPILLLSLFFIIVVLMCNKDSTVLANNTCRKLYELKCNLRLGLFLSVMFILVSAQRCIFSFLHTTLQMINDEHVISFKMPPFQNFYLPGHVVLILSMLHYLSLVVRPLIFITLCPKLKKTYKHYICCCQNSRN